MPDNGGAGQDPYGGGPADYYSLLGIRSDATEGDVKRAYRRLARELHPDSTGGDTVAEAQFKEVSRAYEVLRDPQRRARYDRFGPEGAELSRAAGFGTFGAGGIGDLFDAFFGGGTGTGSGRRSAGAPARGPDAEVVLELTLEEAVFGVHKELVVDGPVACEPCAGSGARPGTSAMRCPECGGTGELHRVRQSILGQVVTAATCPRCAGQGEAITSPCPMCRGEGRRVDTRTVTVDIPGGVDHGATLRMTGQGPVGPRGGPPGDLYVNLVVEPHNRFTRSGNDIRADLHVTMTQAALGAVVAFETLDGAEDITVAPGTQTGAVVRLRGRGAPNVRGRGRGDLLVQVMVDTPIGLNREQEDLLRQLASVRGERVAAPGEGFVSRLRSAFG